MGVWNAAGVNLRGKHNIQLGLVGKVRWKDVMRNLRYYID